MRPTEIHAAPCKHCPSEWYDQDPEAEMLIQECISGKISEEDLLFVCEHGEVYRIVCRRRG